MVAASRRLLQRSSLRGLCADAVSHVLGWPSMIKAHLASSEADEDDYSSSQSARRAREYGSEESSDSDGE